ncbi:hypothetical protein POTOM_009814 [Populus tomentosa]|uniref:Uncharacterized protein n=1 Tax=Populus tomentosa TaxID=118781 RepID=A0A8X8DC15_POPTO|nr:hypothetical protein POTOM_009814 [Populus tomentosa]
MEITAKTYENDVDVNIGNKYFLTTMQSSDDLEVKKWVQEVQKIYGKHNRQGVAAGRSIGFVSCRYYKQEGSIYTQFEIKIIMWPYASLHIPDALFIALKKLEEENEGLLVTTRRVELREAAMEAFPGKDFSRHNWEKLTKEVLGLDFVRHRKITRYDPLTYSNMYAQVFFFC